MVASINAGCDMYLFFNEPDEDFGIMLDAYRSGKISESRMNEALTRILGLKAKMGLHKKIPAQIVPAPEVLQEYLGKQEYKNAAAAIAADAITLVKYKDADVLPMTPEKYKRIMIVYVKGAESPMTQLMKVAMGMAAMQTPADILCAKLREKGFDAFIYESPLDKIQKVAREGKKLDFIDAYHAGKASIQEFKEQQDLVISLFDVMSGRPVFGMSKGGGEIPWYVHDVPTIAISVNTPTMLPDIPTVRTYINAYDARPYTMDALINNLMSGPDAFRGQDPIDSFCGLWDTRI